MEKKLSRIGREPIHWEKNVTVYISGSTVFVTGPKGKVSEILPHINFLRVQFFDIHQRKTLYVKHAQSLTLGIPKYCNDLRISYRQFKSYIGCYRTIISNLVVGVTIGFQKKLKLIGVGYKAIVYHEKNYFTGKRIYTALSLRVGYSHPFDLIVPEELEVKIKGSEILIDGIKKGNVAFFAAKVRAIRFPEPYKGKGILYEKEFIRRKVGKTAKSGKTSK